MSTLRHNFNDIAGRKPEIKADAPKYPPPFSIRFTFEERARLAETKRRAGRLPKGFSGIWHRLTGQYGRIKDVNEREALEAWQRDRTEKDALIFKQLEERETLQRDIKRHRARASETLMQLRADVANFSVVDRDQELQRRKEHEEERRRNRSRRPSGP